MALNLREKAFQFLSTNPEVKYTARQIAEWIFESFPVECNEKREKSKASVLPIITDADLIQQLIAEIGAQRPDLQKKYPAVKTTEERPRKYYFSSKTDEEQITNELSEIPVLTQYNEYSEHELYEKVSEYLKSELGVYSKRIDEKKSKNNKGFNGNKWLFPDIVGFEDLTTNFQKETLDFLKEYKGRNVRLWSFEVKKTINRSNLRQDFFQTVSNSSWANFGYLVAADLDSNARKELDILCGLHGIGFILLNSNNPSESELLIPARERFNLDWNSLDRLIEENNDFKEYIKLVKQFYQTGDSRAKDWD